MAYCSLSQRTGVTSADHPECAVAERSATRDDSPQTAQCQAADTRQNVAGRGTSCWADNPKPQPKAFEGHSDGFPCWWIRSPYRKLKHGGAITVGRTCAARGLRRRPQQTRDLGSSPQTAPAAGGSSVPTNLEGRVGSFANRLDYEYLASRTGFAGRLDGADSRSNFGSGAGIRTLNLAVNRSLNPVQKYRLEFAECRPVLAISTVCHGRCCTTGPSKGCNGMLTACSCLGTLDG